MKECKVSEKVVNMVLDTIKECKEKGICNGIKVSDVKIKELYTDDKGAMHLTIQCIPKSLTKNIEGINFNFITHDDLFGSSRPL